MDESTHIPCSRLILAVVLMSFATASLISATPLPKLCRIGEKLFKKYRR